MANDAIFITHTKKWIIDVVVACNFCPFAAREVKRASIHYEVLHDASAENTMEAALKIMQLMDEDRDVETALLILPNDFESFEDYLDLVETANALLEENEYEGIYQVASFHPQYIFAGAPADDPSNYTNRSPYPMLHFLREESVSKAVDGHPDIDDVPFKNIEFAKEKGLNYMQQLLAQCMLA
ncbi:MAG: DUF1415 domain-containing protein [Sphingobacteriales bacterium]|nr:MAG: DUF1415 domain-containing protein [Sphingobacteriales bacterium]